MPAPPATAPKGLDWVDSPPTVSNVGAATSTAVAAPSSVTASPSTQCQGVTVNLNATSAGNTINWYTASTGGTPIGTSASGANFAVYPTVTTTYYAETKLVGNVSTTFTPNGSTPQTGSIQIWGMPAGNTSATITAYGAQGGGTAGGLGAKMSGTMSVSGTLKILVGKQGETKGASGGGGAISMVTGIY